MNEQVALRDLVLSRLGLRTGRGRTRGNVLAPDGLRWHDPRDGMVIEFTATLPELHEVGGWVARWIYAAERGLDIPDPPFPIATSHPSSHTQEYPLSKSGYFWSERAWQVMADAPPELAV